MVVSASRRTDIPAFYARWLMERVRAGSCEVRNPYRPALRSVVSLRPEDVDCFVFWTRSPSGLLQSLPELEARGFRWYFQYTLLDYPPGFETDAPSLGRRLELLRRAAESVPPGGVVWRYDPIILSSATPPSFHLETFERLADELRGTVERVAVSLLDRYRKCTRGIREMEAEGIRLFAPEEEASAAPGLLESLARIAARHGMALQSCAEPAQATGGAVAAGKCVDNELIRRLWGISVSGARDRSQRPACGCVESRDIGAYESCLHGCRYCYATSSRERALDTYRAVRPGQAALYPG